MSKQTVIIEGNTLYLNTYNQSGQARRIEMKLDEKDMLLSFPDALALLKLDLGIRVCRAGWNGKGMWLAYIAAEQWALVSDTFGEEGNDLKFLPWIGMKTADNKFVPWLASQTDLLADDWCIAGY